MHFTFYAAGWRGLGRVENLMQVSVFANNPWQARYEESQAFAFSKSIEMLHVSICFQASELRMRIASIRGWTMRRVAYLITHISVREQSTPTLSIYYPGIQCIYLIIPLNWPS